LTVTVIVIFVAGFCTGEDFTDAVFGPLAVDTLLKTFFTGTDTGFLALSGVTFLGVAFLTGASFIDKTVAVVVETITDLGGGERLTFTCTPLVVCRTRANPRFANPDTLCALFATVAGFFVTFDAVSLAVIICKIDLAVTVIVDAIETHRFAIFAWFRLDRFAVPPPCNVEGVRLTRLYPFITLSCACRFDLAGTCDAFDLTGLSGG
tara:strand:+ start:5104 stop:5724 length:621 start_codon:yes stop_codon:yes gene_type:complete